MGVISQGQADLFSPAYNPLKYYFSSSESSQAGFRYIVDVYKSGTTQKIFEERVPPRPLDEFGVTDLSALISDFVTGQFQPENLTVDSVFNQWYKFDLKIGELFEQGWDFQDFEEVPSGIFSGYVKVVSTDNHTFVNGDQILINQTVNNEPLLEGLFNVIATPATNEIVIDTKAIDLSIALPYTSPGVILYADRRKTAIRDLLTYADQTAFDAAIPFDNFPAYDYEDYITDGTTTTAKWLSNVPENFRLNPLQPFWLNFLNGYSNVKIKFENSDGDTFEIDSLATGEAVRQVNVGATSTPTLVTGTSPLIKTTTQFYDVWITSQDGLTDYSVKQRFYIDRRCEIESLFVVFKDRFGSYASFPFTLRRYTNGTVQRKTFVSEVGNLEPVVLDKYTYNLYERGKTIFDVISTKEFTLNSPFMTHKENEYFEELMTSGEHFLYDGTNYIAINVTDTNFEIVHEKNKQLIQKTIKVQKSNNDSINI